MFEKLLAIRRQFGALAVMQFLADRAAKRVAGMSTSRVLWLDADTLPPRSATPEGITFRFLSADEVAEFSTDPAHDLDPWLVERAFRGHDLCYAALSGERLASYGWYALHSIDADRFFGVGMSYPGDVAYMYAGFTHPDFRGQRLHAIGMELALRGLADYGVRHLVSYVDWINWPSRRSCQRLGYADLGPMLIGRLGPLAIRHFPSAARKRGVRFGSQADHSRRLALRPTTEQPAPATI